MSDLIETFFTQFNQSPLLRIRSPGRVNLIGEHTDYNDGFVLPLAINLELTILATPRKDKEVHIYSCDFSERKTFDLDNIIYHPHDRWLGYIKGIAYLLQTNFHPLSGCNLLIASQIPQGAGLSSSAALELGIVRLFTKISQIKWNTLSMAKLARKAENEWVGLNCGIMDQLSIATGLKEHALLIDCQTLKIDYIPIPPHISIVILDTGTRRSLVHSAYNERKRECAQVAEYLQVDSLRQVTLETLKTAQAQIDPLCFKRAYHVISENQRVLKACDAMREDQPERLGQLLNESHQSLRDLFEVSSETLDTAAFCAQTFPYCYGAKMTGAGFSGCIVALIESDQIENFKQYLSQHYAKLPYPNPVIYITHAVNGVSCSN